MKAVKAVLWYLAGFVVVPVLDMLTPRTEQKRWRFLDHVYGNKVDGIDGDYGYRRDVPNLFMRRVRWSHLRNPINNYLRSLGPNGTVDDVREWTKGRVFTRIMIVDGERFWFKEIRLFGSWCLIFGYRLFTDHRTKSYLKVGSHFENTMLLWPVKNRRIGT